MLIMKSPHLLFIIIAIGLIISPAVSSADADNIFKENSKAVVVVVTLDKKGEPISQGSGFVVRADGAIVTNYHVISNAKDIKVKVGDKILDVEGLIHTDKENDLVILKAKGEKLQAVKLGDVSKVNVGEKVYVISSPEGLENTISDGLLSGIREIDEKMKILQITAPISPGSSGGPVFNTAGEVIGVATFLIKEAQNLNFAMPVNLVKDKGDSKKILALKETEIEDYEKTAEYWSSLGYSYWISGRYEEAIDACRQAIKISPEDARSHQILGASYDVLGLNKDAIEAYKHAIKINPNDWSSYHNLGNIYLELGMLKEAVDAYEQAVRINPDFAESYKKLGYAYGKSGRATDAIEAFKQAIRINPDDSTAHINLGVSYEKSGMSKEAIEAFKQAIRINPDYAEAHNDLGIAYGELGMYKDAIGAYKQAIKITPDDIQTHYKLYNAYWKLGMFKEVKESCKQIIQFKPDEAKAHLGLGLSCVLLDETGCALEEYKILKKLNPEMAEALFNVIYK
ncbi:MAG: tetratricopeptide repeat protein [Nitrospiraceae bacterium]|nr:MAG: tetratricopeptide repeat protein [Nitrospiraceae bacterium]